MALEFINLARKNPNNDDIYIIGTDDMENEIVRSILPFTVRTTPSVYKHIIQIHFNYDCTELVIGIQISDMGDILPLYFKKTEQEIIDIIQKFIDHKIKMYDANGNVY